MKITNGEVRLCWWMEKGTRSEEWGKDPKFDNTRDRMAIRPRTFRSSDSDHGLFTACWFAREQQVFEPMKFPIQQSCRGSETSPRSNLKSTLPARRSGVFNIARSRRRDSSLPVLSIEQPANPRSPHSTSHGPCSVCRTRRTATPETTRFCNLVRGYDTLVAALRLHTPRFFDDDCL